MYSESESVRQTFGYPSQQVQDSRGGISGKSFNRRAREKKPPQKDQLYFKLKVLKHVGQLVSNLKSSIALFNHDLNEHQLSDTVNLRVFFGKEIQQFYQLRVYFGCFYGQFSGSLPIRWSSQGFQHPTILISFVSPSIAAIYWLTQILNSATNDIIAKDYFESRFPRLFPFLVSTIIQVLVEPKESTFLYFFSRIISFSLLPEITILYKDLQNAISSQNKGQILILFAKLLGKIIFLLHLISLLLNAVRNLEFMMGYKVTWVEQYRSDQSFNGSQLYLLGWYWGSTIVCTVGFGDIVPANNLERAVISFLEVAGALIFGYFMNYIGHLIKMQGEKTDMFEANLRKLNRYLSKTNIPASLKRQARAHFFDREQIVKTYNQQQENQILANLNPNVKKNIMEFSNLELLKSSSISKILNADILKQIAYKMRKMIFAPEQKIYSPDKNSAAKMWVIEKGKVIQRWYSESGKEGKDIAIYTQESQENILGWISFLKSQVYRLTAKSDTFSILHEISREDFTMIVKGNRVNYLQLMEYRDQMILSGRKYVNRCLCCHRLSHSTVDCPKIHFPKRSAYFLCEKHRALTQPSQTNRRANRQRLRKKINWKNIFQKNQSDHNDSREGDQLHPESYGRIMLSPRKSIMRKPSLIKERYSVDQVTDISKKVSLKIIQKQEVNSIKRLSSRMELGSENNSNRSNRNINAEPIIEDFALKTFDRLLPDQQGYFSNGNYLSILQIVQSKFEVRKKRTII